MKIEKHVFGLNTIRKTAKGYAYETPKGVTRYTKDVRSAAWEQIAREFLMERTEYGTPEWVIDAAFRGNPDRLEKIALAQVGAWDLTDRPVEWEVEVVTSVPGVSAYVLVEALDNGKLLRVTMPAGYSPLHI